MFEGNVPLSSRESTITKVQGPQKTSRVQDVDSQESHEEIQETGKGLGVDKHDTFHVVRFSQGAKSHSTEFPTMTEVSSRKMIRFFTAHQDQAPTSMVLNKDSVMVTVGKERIKIRFSDLEEALKTGKIAGDSQLVQAIVVAEKLQGMGLPPRIERQIVRQFMSNIQEGMSPRKAATQAYAQAVAAANLGDDPAGQLDKDRQTVEQASGDLKAKLEPKKFDKVMTEMESLLTQRQEALSSHDFEGAFDAQEKLRALCEKHGVNDIGAPAKEFETEPSTRIFDAAEASPRTTVEREVMKKALNLGVGDSYEVGSDQMIALAGKLGISLSVTPAPGAPGLEMVGAGVDVTAQGGIKLMAKITRKSETEWTVSYRTRVGGDVTGGGRVRVLSNEVLSGSHGEGGGHQVQQSVSFATPRDAGKFLAKVMEEALPGGKTKVKGGPREVRDGVTTPSPGRYVITEDVDGKLRTSVTKKSKLGVVKGKNKSTAQGNGIIDRIRRKIPGLNTGTTTMDRTRYQTTKGDKIHDRSYTFDTGTSLNVFFVKGSRLRTKIDLGVKSSSNTSGKTFSPSLSMQIDGSKVGALEDQKALDILVDKESSRIIELYRQANLDSGKNLFDLSVQGQSQLKQSVRNAITLVRDQMVEQGTAKAWSKNEMLGTDFTVPMGVAKISGGLTLGRVITLKLSFETGTGNGTNARVDPDKVEIGVSKTFQTRFTAGIGVSTKGSPVTVGVELSGSQTSTRKMYERITTSEERKS